MQTRLAILAAAVLAVATPALPAAAEMPMPSVAITSPAQGATVTSTDIPVTIEAKNFDTEMKYMGLPARPGRGHVHVMVDGMDMAHLTNVEVMHHFSIAGDGLAPGKHQITVVLATDDHTMASKPAMVTVDYEPHETTSLPAPANEGTPSITILSPRNGETVGRKFTLRVALKNFHLSCAEGKADVAGYGHIHVIASERGVTDQPAKRMPMSGMMGGGMSGMKGDMAPMSMVGMIGMPCSNTIPVDLSAWKKGKVTLAVMLAGNDHMPVAASPAMVTVNLK